MRNSLSRSAGSPITCSALEARRARRRSTPSSRSTSSLCWPRVGAGAGPDVCGPGRDAHRPGRDTRAADQRMVERLEEAAGAQLRIVERARSRAPSPPRRHPARASSAAASSGGTRRAPLPRASAGVIGSACDDRPRPTRRRPRSGTRRPRRAGRASVAVDRVRITCSAVDRGGDLDHRASRPAALTGAVAVLERGDDRERGVRADHRVDRRRPG